MRNIAVRRGSPKKGGPDFWQVIEYRNPIYNQNSVSFKRPPPEVLIELENEQAAIDYAEQLRTEPINYYVKQPIKQRAKSKRIK
ncbi:MAG: hypothetical protein Q4A84_10975 [Neisseria sp.]|uniref:hypothetical protein n=1 Tax=Neisseria sp. TaxID=192066 RepID=UPI0026DDAF2A|nr:hypothetical protein [Neisseria sp.]MDO4642201.1 hypothetical protein [Neisseria sp.]